MNFSQRIAALLVETNHSQAELSRYIGVKANTVSDWINKGTSPKIEHLYRIADFFSVSFDYLFVGENLDTSELTENEQEMLDIFSKFNDREQIKLIGKLEELYRQKQIKESQQAAALKVSRSPDKKFRRTEISKEELERINNLPEDNDI